MISKSYIYKNILKSNFNFVIAYIRFFKNGSFLLDFNFKKYKQIKYLFVPNPEKVFEKS